jgi:hypothetical protein
MILTCLCGTCRTGTGSIICVGRLFSSVCFVCQEIKRERLELTTFSKGVWLGYCKSDAVIFLGGMGIL